VTRPGGEVMSVDVRCGAARMMPGGDALVMLRQADAALQLARRGSAAVVAWDESAAAQQREQLALSAQLRRAGEARAFGVEYQPIVDAHTGALVSVEALARWTPEHGEAIGPAVFVPALERLGRIEQLTSHVMDRALSEIAVAHDLSVSVNVSPLDVMRGDLVALVRGLLEKHGLRPGLLTLEITESAALEAGTAGLTELAELGVAIAIDDFGRGWSSMELLKRLPASYLKLDRSYVAGITTDATDEAIVRSAVTLARAFEMQVVAEGVERPAVLDAVRRLGCDYVQGFLVGRPMSAAALHDWVDGQATSA
jgi:diguanylate cyclase